MNTTSQKLINLATTSTPYTIVLDSDVELYHFYGSKTLGADFLITVSGTPKEGSMVNMLFSSAVSAGGLYDFTIINTVVPESVVAASFMAVAAYSNSAWKVFVFNMPREGDEATISKGSSGDLGVKTGSITNTQINASAAIAYTKLALAGTILNADINSGAAIVYSKLNLATSILNSDINAAAAIAYTKLALTNSVVNADIASAAAIAYSKLALTNSIVNADVASAAAIVYSKLSLTNSILDADIKTTAAIAHSKMAALTASKILQSDGAGVVSVVDTATYPSLTELSYVKGAASNLQTQISGINTAIKTRTTVTGTTILTAATIKNIILADTTGGAFTTTLPLISTIADGYEIVISCVGHVSNVATIACNASDHIVDQDSVGGVGTLTMAGYWKSYTLHADAATHTWYVIVKIT
jgi:hypothetical protein